LIFFRPVSSALASVGSIALELLAQAIELKIDVLLRFRKELRRVSAEMLLHDSLNHRLEPFEEIGQLQSVPFERRGPV
jgi:hypothetical protein